MGIDACIYIKTKDGEEPRLCHWLPEGIGVRAADGYAPAGATHEIDQGWRYYGPGCERGPWPSIAATLLSLYASPNVEAVWYFGDDERGDEPLTAERFHALNSHYMEVGDRPYRGISK